MKVAFVQDMDPLVHGGGAQLTDRLIIREGWRRGHEVEVVTPETWRNNDYGADLMLLSNTTRFNPAQLRAAGGKSPHVVFHHDYYWCRFRLYFPLEEKCKSCAYLEGWRALFDSAALNVFMSPLHRDACMSVLPELSQRPHALCPSLLEPDDWPAAEGARDPLTVFGLNCLLPYKGRASVLDYARRHGDMRFTFAGAAEGEGDIPANVLWLGPVDDARLKELYSSSWNFIHLPATPQPCERSAIEARLTGCKMIANKLVGITSYDAWSLPDPEFRTWLSDQPRKLWEAIENA